MPRAVCDVVDGRTGWQWVQSIRAYLEWRSGAAWRPVSERWHAEKVPYTQAVNWLNEGFNGTRTCECPYCLGAPFYVGARELAQSKTSTRVSTNSSRLTQALARAKNQARYRTAAA